MENIGKVQALENKLGFPKDSLVNIIAFESAGTFSPSIKNFSGSGAVGLIQFMPTTAVLLGTSTSALAAMSFDEQLVYVEKYFRQDWIYNKLKTSKDGLDIYLAVLYPALIGRPDSALMAKNPSNAYVQNRGLDTNKDGQITKGDIRKYFAKSVNKFRQENNLPASNWLTNLTGSPLLTILLLILFFFTLSKI